ncbi:hypothetical protein BDW62DRAFT_219495 [Aspergillus aurantiobrunneus]
MSPDYLQESTVTKQRVPTVLLPALALGFLVARLISRKLKRVPWGIDDYLLIIGQAFVVALAGINYTATYYGMGRHLIAAIHERLDVIVSMKLLYAFEPLYITGIVLIKFSVLFMYNRIFPVRSIRIGSYILGGITLAWAIALYFVAIFQCTPVRKAWERQIPGHCIDLKLGLMVNGVPNFVTDILILALPIPSIWKLHVSTWQRASVIAVFLSGSFVVFASVYRFSLIFKFEMTDVTWTITDSQTWCVVETSAGIISACLPTIVPVVKYLGGQAVSVAIASLPNSNTRSPAGAKLALKSCAGGNGNQGHPLERMESRGGLVDKYHVQVEHAIESRVSFNVNGAGHEMKKAHGWTVIESNGDSD